MTYLPQNKSEYALGHSIQELERLERQGAFLRDQTRNLLTRAGIGPGMRVLDFGCGAGDVSLLVAELVGPEGRVIGFDRSRESVDLARRRAEAMQLSQASFYVADEHEIGAIVHEASFDALVGRLVLVHQRDVLSALRVLKPLLCSGAILAFLEVDLEAGFWSSHPNPLLDQLWRWIEGIVASGVFRGSLGREVLRAFESLGMQRVSMLREGRLVGHGDPGANGWIAGFSRSMTEPVKRLGLERPGDLSVDALLEKLMQSPDLARACNVPVYMISASGILP